MMSRKEYCQNRKDRVSEYICVRASGASERNQFLYNKCQILSYIIFKKWGGGDSCTGHPPTQNSGGYILPPPPGFTPVLLSTQLIQWDAVRWKNSRCFKPACGGKSSTFWKWHCLRKIALESKRLIHTWWTWCQINWKIIFYPIQQKSMVFT